MFRTLGLSLAVLCVLSCTTNPALETFPLRQVDRTPDNSAKVTDWSPRGVGWQTLDLDGNPTDPTLAFWPFAFQNPAVVNVVPTFDQGFLGTQVPFAADGGNFWVASLNWAPSTDEIFGANNQYTLGLFHRQKTTDDQALDTGLQFTDLYFDEGFSVYLVRLSAAGEWQLTDRLWVRPGIAAYGYLRPSVEKIVGNRRYFMNSGLVAEYPLTFDLGLQLLPRWGFRAGYSLYWLGRPNGSWEQRYIVGLSLVY